MANVVALDNDSVESFLENNEIALIGFWAAWCGPCKMMSPVLSDISAKNRNNYAVGRVNVDDCKEFAEKYHVENLPTLLIFKNGEEVGRVIGYMNPENLDREIADSLV